MRQAVSVVSFRRNTVRCLPYSDVKARRGKPGGTTPRPLPAPDANTKAN